MEYPFKYPELYAELARQGKEKTALANAIGVTPQGLRYKQSLETSGDFTGVEMKKASSFLGKPASCLFNIDDREHEENKNANM